MSNSKAWGGRFQARPDELASRFSASVDVDKRLAPQDIEGSRVHIQMLADCNIVSREDAQHVIEGLNQVESDIAEGRFSWDPAHEDVHMNIEAALTARIGDAAKRLHTARSRNDQVATDMRLWTRGACQKTVAHLDDLVWVLVAQAKKNVDVLLPGYTHLQRAQPVRLAHHLLAWCEMLLRDASRLQDASRRLNESPLGAGALAATTFPIDRNQTAKALGFDRPMRNSLDAVSDRDFLLEALSALSIIAIHMSRIAEELVLWSSQEFGFIEMSDAFTTGSSMMPQKKNPDMAELVRGKTGRVIGSLVSLLVMLKGLPLAYNRDMQEDKLPTFDAFDTVDGCLQVLAGALQSASFRPDAMKRALRTGFVDATELADYLAAKGMPFREAHHTVGRLVTKALQLSTALSELTLEQLREESALFERDVYEVLDLEHAVERRTVLGGPARPEVLRQISGVERILAERGRR